VIKDTVNLTELLLLLLLLSVLLELLMWREKEDVSLICKTTGMFSAKNKQQKLETTFWFSIMFFQLIFLFFYLYF